MGKFSPFSAYLSEQSDFDLWTSAVPGVPLLKRYTLVTNL
jgi:hypothetical protein